MKQRNSHTLGGLLCGAVLIVSVGRSVSARYADWQHAGSMYILTSPEGANLPASATEKDFPLLVRLDGDFFDLTQARPHGADIRFSTPAGTELPYQTDRRSIALEFDQPVVWDDELASQFYLDGTEGLVVSGAVTGTILTLTLKGPGAFERITYLKEMAWSHNNILFGQNGMAALTFCGVLIQPSQSSP